MPVVESAYWVRVKVTEAGSKDNPYHAAIALAWELARQNPGLKFEVAEDKVWAGACHTPGGGSNAAKELQGSDRTSEAYCGIR